MLALVLLAVHLAQASTVCGNAKMIENGLIALRGELPVVSAITLDEKPMKVLANPTTRTFTILVREPNGLTCIIAAGTDFESLVKEDEL
jgi:hypothetical protein